MPNKYADLLNQPIPQSVPLTEDQVPNNAGGFVFAIDRWARLDRFLILGSDSNTYYQSARELTRENAKVVTECWAEDPLRTAKRIGEISFSGRAPKNDAAIFALALGATMGKTDNGPEALARNAAFAQLAIVCRTSTHLFQFVNVARKLGKGFGRAMKRAVANWYSMRTVDSLAYQAIKYRQRDGYTHARLLNMSHAPSKDDEARNNLYRWMKGKPVDKPAEAALQAKVIGQTLPALVQAHLAAMATSNPAEWRALVTQANLPWEALPTEANADAGVWSAMLPFMGLTALIRNLGNLARLGVTSPLSEGEAIAVKRISNEEDIKKSRVHPFSILQASVVYRAGAGVRGGNTWTPSQAILGALDEAFYKAFANVIPNRKRNLIALDVSGSMGARFADSVLTVREAAAALTLVALDTEPTAHVIGFTNGGIGVDGSHGFRTWQGRNGVAPLFGLHKGMRLPEVVNYISNLTFGGTDCALPMLYAMDNNLPVDVFTILTDNETWAGAIHPRAALAMYRAKTGINAKCVVVGMTSTGFSIADPEDAGMLDCVGFDSAVPALIADFARD